MRRLKVSLAEEPSYGALDAYPLKRSSVLCKATGGGRWEPKQEMPLAGARLPGGKAGYEIRLEKEAEKERRRRENPVIKDGGMSLSLLWFIVFSSCFLSDFQYRFPSDPRARRPSSQADLSVDVLASTRRSFILIAVYFEALSHCTTNHYCLLRFLVIPLPALPFLCIYPPFPYISPTIEPERVCMCFYLLYCTLLYSCSLFSWFTLAVALYAILLFVPHGIFA